MRRLAAILEGKEKGDVLACDFDGTIVAGLPKGVIYKDGEIPIGKEMPDAVRTMKDLQGAGHRLILWTCRHGEDLDNAVAWLKERGFTADAVNKNVAGHDFAKGPKVLADRYLDDRSWPPFPGWAALRKDYGLDEAGK